MSENITELNTLRSKLTDWAQELGFADIAVTDLQLDSYVKQLDQWLESGYQADMDWIAQRREMRANPALLQAGVIRAICVRMDYQPPDTQPLKVLDNSDRAYISRYALGRDYHKLVRKRLSTLTQYIQQWVSDNLSSEATQSLFLGDLSQRGFVDSAPILEKPLAEKAGIGWIGKNTLVMNKNAGSWFFLGEVLTNLPIATDNLQVKDQCGKCKACLNVCPTDAFPKPYVLDAKRCISYLTIENKGAIPEPLRAPIGNRVFGCDDCQLICPWNRYSKHSTESDFQPRHNLDNSQLVDLFSWTEEEFLHNTEGSPIRRTGYLGWQRNLAVGLGNGTASENSINQLRKKLTHSQHDLLKEHVNWALQQLT